MSGHVSLSRRLTTSNFLAFGQRSCIITTLSHQQQLRGFNNPRNAPLSREEQEEIASAKRWLDSFAPDKIPRNICDVSFSRSSGPGGQNVNKVNSKATLRLEISKCGQFMPSYFINKFQENTSRYITKDGSEIVIQSDDSRKQSDNIEGCFRKLYHLVVETAALRGETPKEQSDKVEKLQKRDNEARLKMKKMHSSKKAARRGDS